MSKVLVEQIEEAFWRLDKDGVDLAGGSNVRPMGHMIIRAGEEANDWRLVMRSADKRRLGTVFVTSEVLEGAGWAAASEIKTV